MADLLDDLAHELAERAGVAVDLPAGTKNRLLTIAREVAHRTERKNTPLVTFVIGRYVAARGAAGIDAEQALIEALEVVERLLPPAEADA